MKIGRGGVLSKGSMVKDEAVAKDRVKCLDCEAYM